METFEIKLNEALQKLNEEDLALQKLNKKFNNVRELNNQIREKEWENKNPKLTKLLRLKKKKKKKLSIVDSPH